MTRTGWLPGALLIAFFAATFAVIAPGYVHRYHLSALAALGIYLCFLLTIVLVVAPAVVDLQHWKPKLILLPLIWSIPYLTYAAGTGDFQPLAFCRLLLVALPLPLLYRLLPVHDLSRFNRQDFAVGAWLIAVVLTHQLKGVWTVPANLDFMGRLFLISIAAWTWTFVRPVPRLGYTFSFPLMTLKAVLSNFCLFALIAIPLGLIIRFTAWNPQWRGVGSFCVDFLSIFLFIALLEELFFRGFLQSLMTPNLGSSTGAQVLVSCLFGLFHILHAPFPNWRYVLLASVAGWFYGSAFRQGGNLMSSAVMHALVDTLWRTFFSKAA